MYSTILLLILFSQSKNKKDYVTEKEKIIAIKMKETQMKRLNEKAEVLKKEADLIFINEQKVIRSESRRVAIEREEEERRRDEEKRKQEEDLKLLEEEAMIKQKKSKKKKVSRYHVYYDDGDNDCYM